MPDELRGISVVIPCLNEEESIGQVVEAAQEGIRKLDMPGEVIVVDNGSTDRSRKIAEEKGARVVPETIKGYGAALRRGFASATYSIMVMGDGDMTYDFARLDILVQPILDGEAEFVVGNRMANIRPGSMPRLHRYVGNPALSMMLRIMFRRHIVRDAHCGMRAITREAYRSLRCVTTGMEFASEMVVRAIHRGIRMAERDIVYHPRVGESKLSSFRDGWRHLRFMFLHSPTWALLLPGFTMWILGTAIAIPLAFGPVVIGGRHIDIHCMIIGALLNVVSIQFITMGFLAKAYAHHARIWKDAAIERMHRAFSFERIAMIALPLILIGLGMTLKVVVQWVASGFGPLDEARLLFLALLCLVNGTQIAAAGYFFQIMALPRHPDSLPEG
jgi:glycosyltransferase involved in cell wall biosynthesis